MAHSSPPPQAPMTGYLSGSLHPQEPSPLSTYSILGPANYPKSVALWHNPPAQQQQQQPEPSPPQIPAASYTAPPTTPSLLQPLPDQKKHKRTRSGCFTCRSRRIKCDETRPICDRCRKGSRDCVYPSSTGTGAPSKPGLRSVVKGKVPRPQSCGSDSSGYVETDEVRALDPIVDEGEEETSPNSSTHQSPPSASAIPVRSKPELPQQEGSGQPLRRRKGKWQSGGGATTDPAVSCKESSSSPSTEGSSRFESLSTRSASVGFIPLDSVGPPNTAHLSEDLRYYLSYHQDFIDYRHYFLGPSSSNFVHDTILEFALQYEPLLYAIVGFASYHHCVQTGNGKLYSFLRYYNKALTQLRKSLGSGEPYSEATLVTVLVLTTFEEFIGDWVNLIDHHQAAHVLIRDLLSPESASSDEIHRHIFVWYARFDVVAGILAANEVVLGREWYIKREEYDEQQAANDPDNIEKQLALASSINRRFGLEMASLYAKFSRGMIAIEDFIIQNTHLEQTLERMRGILEKFNLEYKVQTYPNQQPLTKDDIVDPYIPGGLHYGPLWEVNFAWIDYYSTKAMFKYQSMLSLRQSSLEELQSLAYEQCRLIESVHRWPDKENGYVFGFKNSIGMVAMFLPKDSKHLMWSRRKFALMEQHGYCVAPKFRISLATLWQMPELNHWWLPNDEGYPDIIREVRAMTEERTNNPRDGFRESVRDMKTLFWNISLDDTESENSPSSVGTDVPWSARPR
ncbi:hypothetical protein P175DRAFT_0494478 [Aspergillus ochraceoroseus IBT 24754]|uniref:Zn(2)-C6 fungal-type domain-containing protein n=2 Tax=Aspergillus ochraceoroseus TaxID=138278 RepID=A0A2T5LST2_9EURO|nr:uncharacterized protein P175DRAFT_0494478 [Aspergillus ochraceoroseus IBT 24754]KKK22354.1 hypothetical protein AOCH_002876 [Aspergillus ochraceoroseus]PTU19339.1 hypothetical protein P175DRAFT_0494478 [Aspergillus ochraceoroseus IBT 24754]